MVTQKRQRQRVSRQARAEAIKAARKRKAQRRRLLAALLSAALLVLGVATFISDGNDTTTETTDTTAAVRTPVSLSAVAPGAVLTGETPCPNADGTSQRVTTFAKAPPRCIDPEKTYEAEIRTSKGSFVMALDAKAAPTTVNNFVVLARYRFYEGIAFHRIIPGFVVQVGDPTATGGGGPGYTIADELPKEPYRIGSVAMANKSAPNTGESQFFIVTGNAGVDLPPQYSLFGTVTDGMDVVRSIEAAGTRQTPTDPGGQPTEVVTIASIDIRER